MPCATCEPTIALGGCYQQNSLAGKLCLLTCIVGSDREYGRAFVKLSGLLKSNGTGRISAVVILGSVYNVNFVNKYYKILGTYVEGGVTLI